MELKIVTLSNGKRVGSFSSPHSFLFEDETVLPAVSHEEAERLKVDFAETEMGDGDIDLSFDITPQIDHQMTLWVNAVQEGKVDVVFCPLPMMVALKQKYDIFCLKALPFRCIRNVSRINKVVSISKQCL